MCFILCGEIMITQLINYYTLNKRCNNTLDCTAKNSICFNKSITLYPNLTPLSKDTVSFGSKTKIAEEIVGEISKNKIFKHWEQSNAKSMAEINALCESFVEPLKKFEWDLRQAMKSLISTESNPNNIIMIGKRGIKSRVKDPKKVTRKANKRNLFSIEQIEKMGDVGGARIILRRANTQDTAAVFSCLKNIVKQGYKVLEVENYRSKASNSYVSQKTLDSFEAYCNKLGQYPSIKNRALPNSYTAVHVSFELPDGKVIELQIMGRDVENFKEIEDLFYKYRCNEDFSEQYKPLHKMFQRIIPKLDNFQKETLDRFIKDSYEHARRFPERSAKVKYSPEKAFLPFPYSLPQELNPVNLYYQMEKCNKAKA